jgi:hypothetical protein
MRLVHIVFTTLSIPTNRRLLAIFIGARAENPHGHALISSKMVTTAREFIHLGIFGFAYIQAGRTR